ncbi:hypothetical protein FH972_023542 [Carpinus fangiana]|uniref:Pseudouridine synthase I TruA alpha/beta domain-containing protein n=1 Tax=Carpinus fangiana TaxID=176857 RepID=A0A5N6KVV6_9ROSI|nr:hypothetical protein FH972_023542 [Carpinus fangiana]
MRPCYSLARSRLQSIPCARRTALVSSPCLAHRNMSSNDYSEWTNEKLVARAKGKRAFDPTKYTTRFIALKFAYLGQRYNGYEHHANNATPLPTIEEELWKALVKTKLIFKTSEDVADLNWDECEYSKCGRTDKGVSAFGQVVGLRVRSNRPKPRGDAAVVSTSDAEEVQEAKEFDSVIDELSYPRILNRVLPEDIRVLAWCPSLPPDFSARFSCRERRYRYFFTQPAFTPLPGAGGVMQRNTGATERDGWLDIDAMRDAASRYLGTHDFRNLSKLDPARQINNFERHIRRADIVEITPEDKVALGFLKHEAAASVNLPEAHQEPKVYYFAVHGSAFLWHQVRHMVAILFMVGQGFENPSIVSDLLDVEKNPTKPFYEMADDAPLVLWDCVFPDPEGPPDVDVMEWIYPDGQEEARDRKQAFSSAGDGRHGPGGINEVLWAGWRRKKIDEILARSLLDVVASQKSAPERDETTSEDFGNPASPHTGRLPHSARLFDGGNAPRLQGAYVPLMKRRRMESPEVSNARWLERKTAEGKVPLHADKSRVS